MPSAPSIATRWDALASALHEYRDVLGGRVTDASAPAPLLDRGWDEALLALTEEELVELEIRGCEAEPPATLPAALRDLFAQSLELCSLPALVPVAPASRRLRRLETSRKRAQVEALARLTPPLLDGATRVVEVGAGHGHLAREIAAQVDRPIVALERDPALSAKARTLDQGEHLTFREVDVLQRGVGLEAGDCALGLHACGELGDALAVEVAEHAQSLLLVGCCLQKLRADARPALHRDHPLSGRLALPKSLLGLSNFTPREQGVEATRAENVRARERRLALHALLSAALGPMRFGAEMDGLNRRAAHGDLSRLVERATSLRGLPMPSELAVAEAQRAAKLLHDRIRRLSLPRILLGRVLEVFVLVDRALHLEMAGFEVSIGTAFPKEVSARNLTLVAVRRGVARAAGRASA